MDYGPEDEHTGWYYAAWMLPLPKAFGQASTKVSIREHIQVLVVLRNVCSWLHTFCCCFGI